MKRHTTILLLSLLVGFSSCEKLKKTWVYYDDKGCTDPWDEVNLIKEEEETKEDIKNYFKEKQIKIYTVELVDYTDPAGCYSCRCTTGIRIECKVKETDVPKMKEEGFYQ